MIPVVGLAVTAWMLQLAAGFALCVGAVMVLLLHSARRRWRQGEVALWEQRLAFAALVWSVLWLVLSLFSLAMVVAFATVVGAHLGVRLISRGNLNVESKAGHEPVGFAPRRLPLVGLVAVAAALTLLLGISQIDAARRQEAQRLAAERIAEGQRNQDYFFGMTPLDGRGGFAVVGTSSTAPSDGDDAWAFRLNSAGDVAERVRHVAPGDQSGRAVARGTAGALLVAGTDRERPFVASVHEGELRTLKLWKAHGTVEALHALEDGGFIAVGRKDSVAWMARVDARGTEVWSRDLAAGMAHPQVKAIAVSGDRFVVVGSDGVMGRDAFMAGGSIRGAVKWTKALPGANAADGRGLAQRSATLSYVAGRSDGTFVALGSRSRALWLLHVTGGGDVLSQRTFGTDSSERAGGLAVAGDTVVLAGTRFRGVRDELRLLGVRLDGELAWERTLPAHEYGRATALQLLPGGDILVAGYRETKHKSDGWVARLAPQGAGTRWQRVFPRISRPQASGSGGRRWQH